MTHPDLKDFHVIIFYENDTYPTAKEIRWELGNLFPDCISKRITLTTEHPSEEFFQKWEERSRANYKNFTLDLVIDLVGGNRGVLVCELLSRSRHGSRALVAHLMSPGQSMERHLSLFHHQGLWPHGFCIAMDHDGWEKEFLSVVERVLVENADAGRRDLVTRQLLWNPDSEPPLWFQKK